MPKPAPMTAAGKAAPTAAASAMIARILCSAACSVSVGGGQGRRGRGESTVVLLLLATQGRHAQRGSPEMRWFGLSTIKSEVAVPPGANKPASHNAPRSERPALGHIAAHHTRRRARACWLRSRLHARLLQSAKLNDILLGANFPKLQHRRRVCSVCSVAGACLCDFKSRRRCRGRPHRPNRVAQQYKRVRD